MKFGETFAEYLRGEQEAFLKKCSHVEYKRLKKVLKSCRTGRDLKSSASNEELEDSNNQLAESCHCNSCPLCDETFFSELMKEASDIAGCFKSKVKRLLQLHISSGLSRYISYLRSCFNDDQQVKIQEGKMLIHYVTMNAIAMRKILKKYDKIHHSVKGRNFKTKLQANHIELLQSPWLIELGAFYINLCGDFGESGDFFMKFSCDLNNNQPLMTMTFSNSVKYEYSLNCAICLDTLFNPYALSCGHLFCKGCACSACSVFLFQGLREATREAKCPVCREANVYKDAVHMTELDLLLKNRCNVYWKERLRDERSMMVKQSKKYWESQTITVLGI